MGPMQFISKFPFIKEQSIKEQEHNSEERLYYMYLHIRALHADWLATYYYYSDRLESGSHCSHSYVTFITLLVISRRPRPIYDSLNVRTSTKKNKSELQSIIPSVRKYVNTRKAIKAQNIILF